MKIVLLNAFLKQHLPTGSRGSHSPEWGCLTLSDRLRCGLKQWQCTFKRVSMYMQIHKETFTVQNMVRRNVRERAHSCSAGLQASSKCHKSDRHSCLRLLFSFTPSKQTQSNQETINRQHIQETVWRSSLETMGNKVGKVDACSRSHIHSSQRSAPHARTIRFICSDFLWLVPNNGFSYGSPAALHSKQPARSSTRPLSQINIPSVICSAYNNESR